MEIPLLLEKLSLVSKEQDDLPTPKSSRETVHVVLLSAGSFNPPTYMHLRLFACRNSEFVMVYPWEAYQGTFQRTLTVLSRVRNSLCENGLVSSATLKVMLLCGSDLLDSFSTPGAWIPEQVRTICRDYGVVCIRRERQDIEKIISSNDILNEYKSNIKIVDEVVPNGISSTLVRDCISRGLSVKYLVADEVIDYIKHNNLYIKSE